MRFSAWSVATAIAAALLLAPSISLADNFHAGSSKLVSKFQTGAPADGGHPSISADGRYVAFESLSRLTSDDTDEDHDIYRYDTVTGQTILVSPTVAGVPHDEAQFMPSISADGNKIAYVSGWDPDNSLLETFEPKVLGSYAIVRDINAGTSRSLAPGYSIEGVKISGNGAWAAVARETESSVGLVAVNTETGSTKFLATQCNGCGAADPSPLSHAGRYVAYSVAEGIIYRHDRDADNNGIFDEPGKTATLRVSYFPNGGSIPYATHPAISGDGTRVTFAGGETRWDDQNFLVGSAPQGFGIYVRDIPSGTSKLVSSNSLGVTGAGVIGERSSISADGRFVGFSSPDPYLAPGDFNAGWDVFLKEIGTGKTYLLTTGFPESELEGCDLVTFSEQAFRCRYDRMEPAVSADASFVVYQSAFYLGKNFRRIFLRDRSGTCAIACMDRLPREIRDGDRCRGGGREALQEDPAPR